MNDVHKAAIQAAELYLERDKQRKLKECIAIAAAQHGVEWLAVANYLSGVGARAMLELRDAMPLYEAAKAVQENHWSVQIGGDRVTGDITYYGVDYEDVITLCTALNDFAEAFDLEPLKRHAA
jgi:hypothetical protein